MTLALFLQIASLVAVLIALVANFWQVRGVMRQTREVGRQTHTTSLAVQKDAYMKMIRESESMARWYLEQRNIDAEDKEKNDRRIYLLLRLGVHESNYIAYDEGYLSEDFWLGWQGALKVDIGADEFQSVWFSVRHMYTARFQRLVEQLSESAWIPHVAKPDENQSSIVDRFDPAISSSQGQRLTP